MVSKKRIMFFLASFVALSVSLISFSMGIFDAIEKKDQKRVEEIVEDKSFNANIILDNGDSKGATPLVFACLQNNKDAVKELLKIENIDVNYGFEGGDGPTSLLIAAQRGNIGIVSLFLNHKDIDVNKFMKTTIGFANSLHIICFSGDTKILEQLLERQDLKINEVVKDGFKAGWTALELAIDSADFQKVKQLLKYGAEITGRAERLAKSKTRFPEIYKEIVKAMDIFQAIESNNEERVKKLVADKAFDVNQVYVNENYKSWTPLYLAIYKNNINIVRELLKVKNIDINKIAYRIFFYEYDFMEPPYCINRILGIYKLGDINTEYEGHVIGPLRVYRSWTPLYLAVYKNNINIVRELLKNKNIDINKTTSSKKTSLFLACKKGFVQIVEELLKHKNIDINKPDIRGDTPLCIASKSGKLEVEKMLLKEKSIYLYRSNYRSNNDGKPIRYDSWLKEDF